MPTPHPIGPAPPPPSLAPRYAPGFFEQLIDCRRPVALAWFLHNRRQLDSEFLMGRVDLGAVLVDASLMRERNVTFMSSMPHQRRTIAREAGEDPTPFDWFLADWWLSHHLVYELELPYCTVKEVLFMHN